jgi:hypothetical protein
VRYRFTVLDIAERCEDCLIIFTFRELKTAWRNASQASDVVGGRNNTHRLLLFYAVENGLKAVLLKRESRQDSENMFADVLHDLNKLMDRLRVGADLRLSSDIRLTCLKPDKQRNAGCGELNQVWRYGAKAQQPSDIELEAKLSTINEWIRGELQ